MRSFLKDFYDLTYQAVTKSEGNIDQVQGDGIIIFFGFQISHEDEPIRAVRCALQIQQDLAQYRGYGQLGIKARIGVHRGQFAITHTPSSNDLPTSAVGSASYVAARLQTLAPEGGVVISQMLKRLIADHFILQTIGFHQLKGLDQEIEAFLVQQEIPEQPAFQSTTSPIIGRQREYGLLQSHWQQSQQGSAQVVLLTGEAGIGKTRLTQSLRNSADPKRTIILETGCKDDQINVSFHPLIRLLRLELKPANSDSRSETTMLKSFLRKLGLSVQDSLPLLQAILTKDAPCKPEQDNNGSSKVVQIIKTVDLLLEILKILGHQKPVLLLLEDIHWADASTLNFLDRWIDEMGNMPVMVIATSREIPKKSWMGRQCVSHLDLRRLENKEAEELILEVGKQKLLPIKLQQLIINNARGIPLFIRELTLMMIEADPPVLKEGERTWIEIRSIDLQMIPMSVEDAIIARLDNIQEGLDLLQLAATVGDSFSHHDLLCLAPAESTSIEACIRRAIDLGILLQDSNDSNTYYFSHALARQALYQMMTEASRKEYHGLIASTASIIGNTSDRRGAERKAFHLFHAGLYSESFDYWWKAGQLAHSEHSLKEANYHYSFALEAIDHEPGHRDCLKTKIEILQRKAPVLMALEGWASPKVGSTCQQWMELCQLTGNPKGKFWASYGVWAHTFVSGNLNKSLCLAEELVDFSTKINDLSMFTAAHNALAYSCCYRADFLRSIEEAEQVLGKLNAENDVSGASHYYMIPSVLSRVSIAHSSWMLGDSQKAWTYLNQARDWVTELRHLPSMATMISIQLNVASWEMNWDKVNQLAHELNILGRKYGLELWQIYAEMHAAKARLETDNSQSHVDDVLRWAGLMRQSGTGFNIIPDTLVICETLLRQDNPDAALEVNTETVTFCKEMEIGLMYPRLLMNRALILLRLNRATEAWHWLEQARSSCFEQGAIHLLPAIEEHLNQLGGLAVS